MCLNSLMKCLKMNIGYILLFIINFIAIYSVKLPMEKTSQATTLVNEEISQNNFYINCPHLLNIIRENNLTNYTVNCKPLNIKNHIISEENVLEYACLIVKNILNFMCEKKINITSDLLKPQNNTNICPYNFSHLEKLGFTFSNNEIINELKNQNHCMKVCSDLYTNKTQCIVLSYFNNYIKNTNIVGIQEDSTTLGVSELSSKSEYPEVIKQNTENVTNLQNKVQLTQKTNLKEVTKEIKVTKSTNINNVEDVIKEEKKIISSTPKKPSTKIEISDSEKKNLDYDNFISDNAELKQKNEDLNEDDINEEDLNSIVEPMPKTDFSQETKQPKIESEIRIDSSFKGKEIYSGDGFFQAEDSHFFFYFIMVSSIVVVAYLAFHNKNKILAYALEGANSRRNRRRPNPARYRKLETNLEEVISSNATNAASSSVVY